ncbi:(d)CMP kinase [Methylotenera versatilis]|uniref:(d)CMP kinase n=1 Tax=Methylotenera versatilis TaxID=1055487 RepID=UPI000646A6D3|nr:(d)CMP kinase [Methylotenera versatilis]
MHNTLTPVITIDGPSASGKGTIAERVAEKLGFHYLDSGALYRIVAFAAKRNNIAWNQADTLGELAKKLHIQFTKGEIYLDGERITEAVRSEEMSRGASEVAIHPPVRDALLGLQRSFRQEPGLVGDGRDMGSVIFTDAPLKIFLTADVETRAERRYKQLINKGLTADYSQILADLQSRDYRDSQRSAAPLIQTADALLLDTTHRNIEQAVAFVLNAYQKHQ